MFRDYQNSLKRAIIAKEFAPQAHKEAIYDV